jgi:hypothetical protein
MPMITIGPTTRFSLLLVARRCLPERGKVKTDYGDCPLVGLLVQILLGEASLTLSCLLLQEASR